MKLTIPNLIKPVLLIVGLAACSDSSPVEPEPVLQSSPQSNLLGLLPPYVANPLYNNPLIADAEEVIAEWESMLEVNEYVVAIAVDTVNYLPLWPPVNNPLAGLPLFSKSTSAPSGPLFHNNNNHHNNSNGGWESSDQQRTNPCTGEDINFHFRTKVVNKRKTFRDGTVRDETRVTSKGKGEVYAPAQYVGVDYNGYEDDYTRTYTGPRRNEDYQDQMTRYIREGNQLNDDDFHLHRRLRIIYDTDGNIVEVKTDKTKFECK